MRRLLLGLVVAVTTVIAPVLAFAGNQEVANQIKQNLDGNLKGHEISIRVQDGAVFLQGHVLTQEQMKTALKTVYQTPGVTKVVNDIVVTASQPAPMVAQQPPQPQVQPAVEPVAATGQQQNPLRNDGKSYWSKLGTQLGSALGTSPETTPTAQADRLADAGDASTVEATSAEEMVIEPKQVAIPQKARPMAATREPQRVAMRQNEVPTPAAVGGAPLPMYAAGAPAGAAPMRYDQPRLPNYAWPSYASYPNYAAVTYPKQYSPTAWPFIGPFYPYPQVPMGWRKVSLEWSDGWWFLDFKDQPASCWQR